jgi:glycosyltransferase involved in cell wall biosynthesis
MEAGASGKPVIATNIDGVADFLIDEKNALLVPVKDPNALAAAMMRLIKDVELRTRLSASIKSTVSEGFAVETMVKRIGDLYQDAYSMRFG